MLDKKSSNISKQILTLQRKVDNVDKLKTKIEKLKVELTKVKRAKELELDEISLMYNTYSKMKEQQQEEPKTKEEVLAEQAYAKLS